MDEQELQGKLKTWKESLGRFFVGWIGRYFPDKDQKSLLRLLKTVGRGLFSSLLGFAFAHASAFGGLTPFGLSLLAAAEETTPWILLGVVLSSLTGRLRLVWSATALLITAMRLFVGVLLHGKRGPFFAEPLSIRLAVGAAGGFTVGLYGIVAGGFETSFLWEAFFLIGAVPLFAFLYDGVKRHGYRRDGGRLAVSYTLTLCAAALPLSSLSPALLAAMLFTLSTALIGGGFRGALVGAVTGFGCGSAFSALLALIGGVGGAVKKKGTALAALAACGVGVLFAFGQYGELSLVRVVPSLLWGGVLLLPAARLGLLPRLSVFEGQEGMSGRAGAAALIDKETASDVRGRLNALSEAMSSLSEVFYALSNRLSSPDAHKLRELCEDCFRRSCEHCSQRDRCWGRDYERTADVMNQLAVATLRHGAADTAYIPDDFLTACPFACTAVKEINVSHARLLEEAARCNKTEVVALDYEAIAALLRGASEETAAEFAVCRSLTEKAREAARSMDLGFHSIAVYGKRRLTLLAGGLDLTRVRMSTEEMRAAFEHACGFSMTLPEFRVDDDYTTMTATSRRLLSCESARASLKKKNEEVSGDTAVVFENREDRLYALISDGMGSGPDAAITSRTTAIFLEKLLSVGNRKNTVLTMLNHFIRHKNLECFTTVDLLEIDLLSAEASFVKSGAAASYIVRSGKLFKIASTSLPIGITREITAEEIRFHLEPNDLVVMISDGIAQSFEDGLWLTEMLSEEILPTSPLPSIARAILERAKQKNERSDDMTVVVLRAEAC